MAVTAPSLQSLAVPAVADVSTIVLVAAALALYARGVRRLRARGRDWPRRRIVCAGAGGGVVLVATTSGLARYDDVLFSVHMAQHVLLGMVAPPLVVAAAPLTLLLRSGRADTTELARRVLRHPVTRAATHPAVAFAVFAATMVALTVSPLHALVLRHPVLHAWSHVHLVVAGCVLVAGVAGPDPHPVRLPYAARVLLVALTLPVHAVLGAALATADTAIAAEWYAAAQEPWGGSLVADQRLGAGLLWVSGEVFGVALAAWVLASWMAASQRAADRADRRAAGALAGGAP